MSLIECPECKNKISDTIESCIHCGFNISKNISKKVILPTQLDPNVLNEAGPNIKPPEDATEEVAVENEVTAEDVVNFIFGMIYLAIMVLFYFDDTINLESGASILGAIIAFGLLYILQKIVRGVVVTIARSTDVFK